MNSCELLKHHLRKYGEQATRQHERLGPHLAECEHCRGLLEAWHRVPGLLDGLPDREPGDILQRRTLKAITQDDSSARPPMRRSPRMAASLATAAVLFAAVGISRHLIDSEYPRSPLPAFKEEYESLSGPLPEPPRSTTEVDYFRPGASDNPAQVIDEDGRIFGGHERSESVAEEQLDSNGLRRGQLAGNLAVESEPPADRQAAATRSYPGATGEGQDRSGHSEIFTDDAMEPAPRRSSVDTPGIASGTVDALRHMAKKPKTESDLEAGAKRDIREGESRERQLKDNAEQQHAYRQMREDKKASAGNYHGKAIEAPVINERLGSAHFDFDNTLEQLQFQPAEGYWANTHVPGDPAIRLLRSRLAQWDREGSKLLSGLEQDVRPLRQPFDAPADNALALSLMSDTSAVDGATRMRIQVGVRGIEHRRGQRPAMNMALVIDLPPGADDDSRIAARALLDAALASKQSGDRFSLVINGPESLVVTPEDFRFGPLQMARQAIAGNRQPLPDNDGNLAQAISQAASIVRQSDDPSLPLGSSSILLISAGGLDNSEQLASLVHG
ncbi:MAG: hypothetical protein KJO85_06625, partial [Gammaproteobacteria bacterium]|nr:hypothetical protein [Gammaproteobacteria bacterium]